MSDDDTKGVKTLLLTNDNLFYRIQIFVSAQNVDLRCNGPWHPRQENTMRTPMLARWRWRRRRLCMENFRRRLKIFLLLHIVVTEHSFALRLLQVWLIPITDRRLWVKL